MTTHYVMFGTDIVSCIYADQWNQSSQVDGPISGFVDAKQGAGDILATFRPGSRLLTWQSIAAKLGEPEQPTIVYPKHHEQALLRQIEPLPSALRSQLQALALPQPPDYVIEWQRFHGSFAEASELTDGYDSTVPTEHLIQSTVELSSRNEHQLTEAQVRQVQLIQMLTNEFDHLLRIVDFGGAAGANYHVLPEELKQRIGSWTVVETSQVVSRAAKAFRHIEKLDFVESITDIEPRPDYILASSSLQYVPNAEAYLKELIELQGRYICIDRTPMSLDDETRVYLQRVHREHGSYSYETSYPLECRPMEAYTKLVKEHYDCLKSVTLNDESLISNGQREAYHFLLYGKSLRV